MFVLRRDIISKWSTRLFFLTLALLVVVGCSRMNIGSSAKGDSMKIQKTGSQYQITLNGQSCATFCVPEMKGGPVPKVSIKDAGDGWQKVSMSWELKSEVAQDELSVCFDLSMEPDFWWAPHISPYEGMVVGQHVLRAPALIAQEKSTTLVIAPDLDVTSNRLENPWFMDMNAPQKKMWVGMVKEEVVSKSPVRQFFKKLPGMVFSPGTIKLNFYVSAYHDREEVRNPWGKVTLMQWERWGHPLFEDGEPIHAPLDAYMKRTYTWAFDTWGDYVWQEFDLNGKRVGAPQFIVNISQSPNYKGEWYQREMLSIWNQAWFSSLRSASGLYRYARSVGDKELLRKARLTKELALAAPMEDGLFPGVIAVPHEDKVIKGKKYRRPRGWDEAYWTNSNRRPREHGIKKDWYHLLDSSWTCLLMLRWYEELEKDPNLLKYCVTYGNKLITLQDKDGFFPGWLEPETHKPGPIMNQTPESSMSVTFLIKLAQMTGDSRYRQSALKCMNALLEEVVPDGRWEDFETFWSSSPWGREDNIGKKVARNGMYKQCNFSTFWTAEALLECYRDTKDRKYLLWGRRTLDELAMTQQVWQAPFIYVPALGGFGVMNADGEWNDSRQSLFGELFLEYYREMGDPSLFERGVSSVEAGFIMMYCPENPTVKKQWEKAHPWFGPEDYGFTMENYAHGARTSPDGGGMGGFTIYDWGNGAASEGAARMIDHYGHVFIDRPRGQAFGVDNIAVKKTAQGWEIKDRAGAERDIKVVYEDGTSRTMHIKDKITVR
jgi:hypothetical protein